jgi:RimJ/RimL family protein N-acetyltransferase
MSEHQAWFNRAHLDETRKLLIVQEAQIPLGFVQMRNVSFGSVADWGFYLRPDAPLGSGQKLGWTSLEYAFSKLGIHKICGQCIESNHASIAFHKKLGFQQEGLLREQKLIDSKYHSLFCFGLIRTEWQPDRLKQKDKNAAN